MPKIKKLIKCPCGQEEVELERDEDGDWIGSCGKCGRNLGRAATRAEVRSDETFFSTPAAPPKREKKGFWD